MFRVSSRCSTALIVTSLFGAFTASGQEPTCRYSVASLQGNYAVVLTYGANIAAGMQVEQLDGKGNVTRSGPINQPTVGSATGERTISRVTSVGTYTVNCDGTGVLTRVVTQTNGTSALTVDDFSGAHRSGEESANRRMDRYGDVRHAANSERCGAGRHLRDSCAYPVAVAVTGAVVREVLSAVASG